MSLPRKITALFVATVLAMASLPRIASADAAADKALAAQLFADARGLMKKGNYDAACPKLVRAHQLDDSADGIVWNLGLCFEGWGKNATAWTYYNDAHLRAIKAGNKEREKATKDKMDLVAPLISKITIHVESTSRVDGLAIAIDGVALAPADWETPLGRDPGPHHVTAEAPGHAPWSTDVDLGKKADFQKVDVPKLTSIVETPKPLPVEQPKMVDDKKPATTSAEGSKTGAWLVLGVGGVFAVGAVGSFLLTKSAQSDRKDFCESQYVTGCPDDDSKSRIHRWGTLTYVSAGLAVVGIGVGIVLLTRSSSSSPTMQVGTAAIGSGPGLQLVGAF
jgi:hypothetical protein